MSAREYSKVSPAVWRSPRFNGLSEKGKVCYLYLITNGHVTSAGCYHLPDGYACTDLQWSQETYDETRAELIGAGMIDHDPEHSVILIERWFKHNGPMNDNHAKGTMKLIDDIESERLRNKALDAFSEANEARQLRQLAKDRKKTDTPERLLPSTNLLRTRIMQGGAA